MPINKLYIFVEGNDDALFFQTLVMPLLFRHYNDMEIIQYAQMKRIKINKYLESINMLGFDYVLVTDIDQEASVKNKRLTIQNRYDIAEFEKIVVVIAEIESWYLSGIPSELANIWGIQDYKRTELVVKEEFNLLYGRKFHSRIDFMHEVLKHYNFNIAITKNKSLEYFYRTYIEKNK